MWYFLFSAHLLPKKRFRLWKKGWWQHLAVLPARKDNWCIPWHHSVSVRPACSPQMPLPLRHNSNLLLNVSGHIWYHCYNSLDILRLNHPALHIHNTKLSVSLSCSHKFLPRNQTKAVTADLIPDSMQSGHWHRNSRYCKNLNHLGIQSSPLAPKKLFPLPVP